MRSRNARRVATESLAAHRAPCAWKSTAITASSILTGVAIWALASHGLHSPLFPSPLAIVRAGGGMLLDGSLVKDAAVSLQRIGIGFGIGCAVGIPLGLAMGLYRPVRVFFDPYVQFLRFVPPIAWLIPAIMWFGIGEVSKVLIIFDMTVFLVLLNTIAGVAAVRRNHVRSALCFGAGRWQIFAWVIFPAAMPYIVAGARIAMGNSFAAVVGAELIAANAGLGYLIVDSGTWLAMDNMFAAMLTLALLGIAADRLFRSLTGRLLRPYLAHVTDIR